MFGVHPIHAARVAGAKAVDVLDRQLCLAQTSNAHHHADTLDNGSAVPRELAADGPEIPGAAYETFAKRTVRHPVACRQRANRWKLAFHRGLGLGAGRTAEFAADLGVFAIEGFGGADVDVLDRFEELGKRIELAAFFQQQRAHLTLESSRVVSHRRCTFELAPFRLAVGRRENHHDILRFLDAALQRYHPVVSPTDGGAVEKARHAIAGEAAMEFQHEVLIAVAVAEEGLRHGSESNRRRREGPPRHLVPLQDGQKLRTNPMPALPQCQRRG